MGLALTLIPIAYGAGTHLWIGHSRIQLDSDYALFAQIPGCHDRGEQYPRKPVAESRKLDHFTEVGTWVSEGYEHVREDPYGLPLEYMLAKDLGRVDSSEASPWNRAAFAFIRALPEMTPVVLWWN